MSIDLEIKQWDGKSANDIEAIYHRHCHKSSFISDTVGLLSDGKLQKGASWLIKRYLENKNQIRKTDIAIIFDILGTVERWESKLHILQSLPFFPIEKGQKKKVEKFLRSCLSDSNKFVRAWAYNGFYELAVQHPEYKKETKQFFEMAMKDEAPPVKSRIRNIMKKGF